MSRRVCLVFLGLFLSVQIQAQQVTIQHGNTLSQLINSLYGGDGIELAETGHQAHFGQTGDLQRFTRTLQAVLQARSFFPIPSAVGLVSYHFDEATGTYQRVQGALGPILSERGSTTGKGNLNLSMSYTFADYEQIGGNDIVELVLPHCMTVACTGGHPEAPYLQDTIHVQLHFRLKSQALTFAAIYGIANNADIGIVVPYVRNDLQVFTHAFVLVSPESSPATHHFDPAVETPDQFGTGDAIGIGDITMRGKYRLPVHGIDSAAILDLTLPTGDRENFLGTGRTRLRASYIASKTIKRFTPHLNAGYELDFGETKLNGFAYTLGTEIMASPKMTLTTDLIGVVRPRAADAFASPVLPDVQLVGRSEIDGAIGGKWKLGGDRAFLFNLLLPLNRSGIRPSYVVTAGLQGTM